MTLAVFDSRRFALYQRKSRQLMVAQEHKWYRALVAEPSGGAPLQCR
jgi:hypothetical protein